MMVGGLSSDACDGHRKQPNEGSVEVEATVRLYVWCRFSHALSAGSSMGARKEDHHGFCGTVRLDLMG